MKIVRIFDNHLFSFKFEENVNEFQRLFNLWNDIEYLEDFFDTNQKDLQCSFWEYISVDEAIEKTIYEAQILEDKLYELSQQRNKTDGLETLFRPLIDSQTRIVELNKSKAKRNWLRIYALKIEPNAYIIIGGTIKLTRTMQEREHTQNELNKIEKCRQYLLSEGIIDIEGITEAFEI